MDFLSKIGDTITEAGNAATEKAKEVSEITKLKCRIRKNETAIQEAYAKIGKTVYQCLKAEKEYPDFAKEIEIVEAAEADIKLCKEYISGIKGVDICPQCGGEVEKNSVFCRYCGARMEQE